MGLFLNKRNQLIENQFGLRKSRSTIDAVVRLIDMAADGFECRNFIRGSLDLSTAFISADNEILLDRLESHGIREIGLVRM